MTVTHLRGDILRNAWFFVVLTCLCELCWVYGFSVAETWWHWSIVIATIIVDFYFLSVACKSLPTGTVYAIFAAAGTIGTTLMDIFIFDKPFSVPKGVFIGILIAGVISLKIADNHSEDQKDEGVIS